MLESVLMRIPDDAFSGVSSVLFVPLVAPKDHGKEKSGNQVAYLAQHHVSVSIAFGGKHIQSASGPTELRGRFTNRSRTAIVLCDDFIGTGETAEEAIAEYQAHLRNADDQLAVLCLVAQQQGLNRVLRLAPAYCHTIRSKGITDSALLPDREAARRLMSAIEARLSVHPDYAFGYRRSEALVAMERTPNNTFPVFWDTPKIDGVPWPAPFPRHSR
jgi:hypothetical protein